MCCARSTDPSGACQGSNDQLLSDFQHINAITLALIKDYDQVFEKVNYHPYYICYVRTHHLSCWSPPSFALPSLTKAYAFPFFTSRSERFMTISQNKMSRMRSPLSPLVRTLVGSHTVPFAICAQAQLWLRKGDVVMVMEMHESGWWLGRLSYGGRRTEEAPRVLESGGGAVQPAGYFPAAYCAYLSGRHCQDTDNENAWEEGYE